MLAQAVPFNCDTEFVYVQCNTWSKILIVDISQSLLCWWNAQLVVCLCQGNTEDTGSAAKYTADGLKQLVASSRGIAATMPADSSISPTDILDAADDILDKTASLMAAAKTAADDPDNPNSRAQMTQVSTEHCCHTDLSSPFVFIFTVFLEVICANCSANDTLFSMYLSKRNMFVWFVCIDKVIHRLFHSIML